MEAPRPDALEYLADGHGNVRIMGIQVFEPVTKQVTDAIDYYYRRRESRVWEKLGTFRFLEGAGFNPYVVDKKRDVVYGFKMYNGQYALYSVALDGSMREELLFASPKADVARVVRSGDNFPIAGVMLETEKRDIVYLDKDVKDIVNSLSRALADQWPAQSPSDVRIVDCSVDGNELLLLFAGDAIPGRYYLYNRMTKHFNELLLARGALEGGNLSPVKEVSYRAADGTQISADLILPQGRPGRNLPTLVMPHGGSTPRDVGGFDWIAQYFASQGYAVLRPKHRGAARYGQTWFRKGEWSLWRRSVNDVNDGGRWLIEEGIADPSKLGIFGWSFGGYVALQVNVVDPKLYKAVVAVAPFTLARQSQWQYRHLNREYRGEGKELEARLPSEHAGQFKAPVLLFHGEQDTLIPVEESRFMHDRLKEARKQSELVTYPKLGHFLEDSAAREDLLRKSDAFFRKAMDVD